MLIGDLLPQQHVLRLDKHPRLVRGRMCHVQLSCATVAHTCHLRLSFTTIIHILVRVGGCTLLEF